MPALVTRFEAMQAARSVAFDKPWSEGILRVLQTEQYRSRTRHDSAWLAKVLGLSIDEVASCLEQLVTADVLQRRGDTYREIRPLSCCRVDPTRGSRPGESSSRPLACGMTPS